MYNMVVVFFLMIRRPPRATRTDTLFPYTTLFRSSVGASMKIGLLSRNANLYSTTRLKEAAEGRGHEVRVIDYLRCVMDITSHKPAIRYAGQELEGYDAIIPRIGASHTFYGTAVVRQFEMMSVFPTNESRSEEHTSELQSLMRISYAVFCLKK